MLFFLEDVMIVQKKNSHIDHLTNQH
jgi:hypothetical protein